MILEYEDEAIFPCSRRKLVLPEKDYRLAKIICQRHEVDVSLDHDVDLHRPLPTTLNSPAALLLSGSMDFHLSPHCAYSLRCNT